MQDLTPQQKKLLKLAKLADKGNIALLEELDALEAKLDFVNEKADFAVSVAEDTQTSINEHKEELTDEKISSLIKPLIPQISDGRDGKDGRDYILTEKDKKDIASKIEVPIVEKTVEKTTTIIEKPTITEITKEVAVLDPETLPQYGAKFRDGLELLEGDERLDKKAIKGLDYLENEVKRLGIAKDHQLYTGISERRALELIRDNSTSDGVVWSIAPTNPTDTATAGEIAYDASYFYVAVADNTWKRTALSTWAVTNSYLLIETGDFILLESGDKLILS